MFFWNSLLFQWSSRCWLRWSSGCLVPLPFLKPAWTSGRSWFTYCWILAWRILSITLLVCEMSALDCKEIQPIHSEGDQPWDFFGRNDAKFETRIFWPPHAKSWLIGKDPDAGRDLGQKEKGMTEDELAGWHHQLDGHEFEWTLGVGDGQGGLGFCNLWGHKESDMTEWLTWTELNDCF